MANENEQFSSGCVKVIAAKDCNLPQSYWFEIPVRFGLWSYLFAELPKFLENFYACGTETKPETIKLTQIMQAGKQVPAVILTDMDIDSISGFGVCVFSPTADTDFTNRDQPATASDILIRVFAPNDSKLPVCKMIDLQVIAVAVKQLITEFDCRHLWTFNGCESSIQSLFLKSIKTVATDSRGAMVRSSREFIDLSVRFTFSETFN
jgi:hypothetical protein